MPKKLYENGPPMPAEDTDKVPIPKEASPKESDFSSGVKKLANPTDNIEKKLKEMDE